MNYLKSSHILYSSLRIPNYTVLQKDLFIPMSWTDCRISVKVGGHAWSVISRIAQEILNSCSYSSVISGPESLGYYCHLSDNRLIYYLYCMRVNTHCEAYRSDTNQNPNGLAKTDWSKPKPEHIWGETILRMKKSPKKCPKAGWSIEVQSQLYRRFQSPVAPIR